MTTWSDDRFRAIADVVSAHAGLTFPGNRIAATEAGIRRAMIRAGVADADRYLAHLLSKSAHLEPLITELTIGETYFFRQRAHFDLIARHILPEVRLRRGAGHVARVWSAGCASGEEAFSLAVTMADAGVPGRVLGTDVCRRALARARAAEYRRWSLRGMAPGDIARVLRQHGERWVVGDQYRRMVTFAPHNLARGHYPPQAEPFECFDLILCRNVFIYFDERTIAHVTSGLVASLADGGWLLTGPHDPPLVHPQLVRATIGESSVYRRDLESADSSASIDTGGADVAASVGEWAVAQAETPVGDTTAPAPDDNADTALGLAREAFATGRYEEALRLTNSSADEHGAVVRTHAVANARGSAAALVEVDGQLRHHPMSAALHLIKALLLVDLRRIDEATISLRHTLYLDPASAIANTLLRHPAAPMHWLPGIANAPLTQTDREAIGPRAAETA